MDDDTTTENTPSGLTFASKEETPEREKTLLFSLNGEDFFIENRKRPNLSFGYMRRLRTEGEVAAESWMMEKMLGLEALEALENFDDMTDDDATALNTRLREIAMGGSGPKA